MSKRRTRVIPKNVLAQEELRRKYVAEPWPQKLILVKSALKKDSAIRVRGSITKLFYNLSDPYLYIDERDLVGLGDMVTQEKEVTQKAVKKHIQKEADDETIIPDGKRAISAQDSSTNTLRIKPVRPKKRKRGRPRKSSRSTINDSPDNEKVGGVSTRINE